MLREGRPELVVAFSGGKGTAHMVSLALAAGVRIVKVSDDDIDKRQLAGVARMISLPIAHYWQRFGERAPNLSTNVHYRLSDQGRVPGGGSSQDRDAVADGRD
jgi:hypothetical protein